MGTNALPKHVAYLVTPGISYVVMELATWAARCCAVPLSVHSPILELEYFIEQSQACLCVADPLMESKLMPVAEKLNRAFALIQTEGNTGVFQPVGRPLEKPCTNDASRDSNGLILYTSGTTGKPKGVVHTYSSLNAAYESLGQAWKWSDNDHTLHVLPCHHIHGVQNILNTAIYHGAIVEFAPFDAEHCMNRLVSGDITCFHAVPTVYTKYTQFLDKLDAAKRAEYCKGMRNDKLRYMVSGSAALPIPIMKAWADISGHVLLERYGMTEIGMGLSNKIDDTRFPGCVGWPLPQVECKLDDEGGILIKGQTVFKEYYRNPDATAKEFTVDGWFKTGDHAFFGKFGDEAQQLQDAAREIEAATGRPNASAASTPHPDLKTIRGIMGRASVDIIKSGGYKLSALEIENVMLTHPAIAECAVVGKPDDTWGEKVTCVAVLKAGQHLAIKELRDWGKDLMATYKVPQALDVVDQLPRNQLGKVEKKKILEKWR